MPAACEIRADYDREALTVYQAYPVAIAAPALQHQLPHKSIQVGLSRHIIERYVNDWTVQITDCTPLVRKLYRLIQTGNAVKARELLPKERVYPVPPEIARRIGIR